MQTTKGHNGKMDRRPGRARRWTASLTAAVMLFSVLALPVRALAPSVAGAVQTLRRAHAPARRAKVTKGTDVRALDKKQMRGLWGSGPNPPYRNPGFCGVLPWQRSFRDVNLCNGNLFKSFTDIQVAPARGAGLVLQRTYNSQDARVGPFGIGWTHAYDIRMAEDGNNEVPRYDFFGGKHVYKRDADGLYSPPAYLYDETESEYSTFVSDGPPRVLEDKQVGMDGTTKRFVPDGTDADGIPSSTRVCYQIEDRHENSTWLVYDTVPLPGGGTWKRLQSVWDASNRSLLFTWHQFDAQDPTSWRITSVQGPLYRVDYAYHTDPDEAASYLNLASVTLDAGEGGLGRTTRYTYTHHTGSQGRADGLLASITDPLGHKVSYRYMDTDPYSGIPINTGTVWVQDITEHGVHDPWMDAPLRWEFYHTIGGTNAQQVTLRHPDENPYRVRVTCKVDFALRCLELRSGGQYSTLYTNLYEPYTNNLLVQDLWDSGIGGGRARNVIRVYTPHGQVERERVAGFAGEETTHAYYDASKYFQKKKVTDAKGRITWFDYFAKSDSKGDRGNVAWVRDAGFADPDSPSHNKQFDYYYHASGQKAWEKNPDGVWTQYLYEPDQDPWGNLTRVVQDPGAGRLNRTTRLWYDAAGRVSTSQDPKGQYSSFVYNTLGQPETATFRDAAYQVEETIGYTYGGNGRTERVDVSRGGDLRTTTIGYEEGYGGGNDRVARVSDSITGTIEYTYLATGERATMRLPGTSAPWRYEYHPDFWQVGPAQGLGNVLSQDDPNSVSLMLKAVLDERGEPVGFELSNSGRLGLALSHPTRDAQGVPLRNGDGDYAYQKQSLYAYDRATVDTDASHFYLDSVETTWSGPNPHLLHRNAYQYDKVGNRTHHQITSPSGASRTEEYGYDYANRLTSVNYGDGHTQVYSFDALGNRLQKHDLVGSASTTESYGFDASNRLTHRNSATANYVNDANGNTLEGGGRANLWDSQNRLIRSERSGVVSQFTYGADGLRRSMTVTQPGQSAVTTHYVYDGQSLVQEGEVVGGVYTPQVTYLSGARGPELRRDDTLPGLSAYRWYLYDGLGSVVGELDHTGAITATRKLDVFGLSRGTTGTPKSKHGFVGGLGHSTDEETGLVYMKARYYDPAIGRFISEDPAMDGVNWFVYCANNPVNNVDPNGESWTKIVALIGTAFLVVLGKVEDHDLLPPFWAKMAIWADSQITALAYTLEALNAATASGETGDLYGAKRSAYIGTNAVMAGLMTFLSWYELYTMLHLGPDGCDQPGWGGE